MDLKKNPKVALENYSKIFMQIGLVLALFIVYNLLEAKTYEKHIEDLSDVVMANEVIEDVPIVEHKITPPPEPKKAIVPERVLVVEDMKDIEESIIESTETDETEAIAEYVEPEEIEEVEEVEEVVEDVPFMIIEEAPVFPGCKGNKQELKKCFSKKMKEFFLKKFDAELAQELGLAKGKKKIYVQFKINKNGIISDVKSRAPHPRLKKEATEIIASLPKMKPGKQRGRSVGVRYTLPITFLIQ